VLFCEDKSMDIKDLIQEHIVIEQSFNQYFTKLLKEMIVHRADERDDEVGSELLKTLVLRYAESECQLVELNNLKNKFLGIAAHDLRNPLTSIRGFSEILLEDGDKLSEDQKEMITIIHDTGEQMLALVNDLLDVAVIESGKLQLQLVHGSLRDCVEERIKLCRLVAQKKNIRISSDLAGEVPAIEFDPNRIAQVIDNLIGNAIKFSPFDSHIFVTLELQDAAVKVSVKDEGPGISEEDRKKLFGDFQRLSARPTGGEKSTGLGLAIVKKIIEAHRGSLNVESKPGKGAVFSFELPVNR